MLVKDGRSLSAHNNPISQGRRSIIMRSMRVRALGTGEGHGGEVFSCVYAADSAFVLSAGWDGYLRLWVASTAKSVSSLQASAKPLSCCTINADATTWLSGSMDGQLCSWDAMTHQLKLNCIAHIRPISAIEFSPDGRSLATASWDRKLTLRNLGKEREGISLSAHSDVVTGCRWTPDGKQLVSWSHDGSLRLWDAETGRELAQLSGHEDRITAGCVSRNGHWAISGGRDGAIKLWDLRQRAEVRSVALNAEIRGCWCLLDGESAVTASSDGWLVLWSLPDFQVQNEFASDIKIMCGDLSPAGSDIALGSEEGHIHFVTIDGIEGAPMIVTPTQTQRPARGVIGRILGKPKMERVYQYTCPACRNTAQTLHLPSEAIPCGACQRLLRISAETLELQSP
jgi:WD40 repeat protein